MPLPELSLKYLPYAVKSINSEGWIHIYLHESYPTNEEEAKLKAREKVEKELSELKVDIDMIRTRIVREVAPRTAQICVDVKIIK